MPTIEEREMALVNTVMAERKRLPVWSGYIQRNDCSVSEALCRALKAHDATLAEFEAFKREVSDAVNGFERYCTVTDTPFPADLFRFIIPKPVDPLVEAVNEAWGWRSPHEDVTENLRAALAKHGLKLVEVGDEL